MRKSMKRTAAERLGYRWMMRCLRALDAAQRVGQRKIKESGTESVDLAHPDRQVAVTVKEIMAKSFKGTFRDFKRKFSAAAKEAVLMLRAGSIPSGLKIERFAPPPIEGKKPPLRYKVTIIVRW